MDPAIGFEPMLEESESSVLPVRRHGNKNGVGGGTRTPMSEEMRLQRIEPAICSTPTKIMVYHGADHWNQGGPPH
jgi:hypothetical protein